MPAYFAAPPPNSSLAPAAPVPVSAEARLAYVLRHFRLAYEHVPAAAVGYGERAGNVIIGDQSGIFFAENAPYPPDPNWREWRGQRVPFFFDDSRQPELIAGSAGRVTVSADLVSAAFYLLSGWQEYFSTERDRHGRFPYTASVQKQHGFAALPVVNYYFDVLRAAVEQATGVRLSPRRWPEGASLAAFVSHDVDNLRSAWKGPAKAALRGGQLGRFARLVWQRFRRPDRWDNLETVAEATARYGARSTFFMLPEPRRAADGTPNADYAYDVGLTRRLEKIRAERHCEWHQHGSIGTAVDAAHLADERRRTPGFKEKFVRFHYLRWEPRLTPAVLDQAGYQLDATLGFAEHFGFRNAYCLPFHLFDFAAGSAHGFLEVPLHVMDATLHHPNYLQLSAQEILLALKPLFDEVEKFGGLISLLWHNENFDPQNTVNGPAEFADIMQNLRARGAVFLSATDILAHLRESVDN